MFGAMSRPSPTLLAIPSAFAGGAGESPLLFHGAVRALLVAAALGRAGVAAPRRAGLRSQHASVLAPHPLRLLHAAHRPALGAPRRVVCWPAATGLGSGRGVAAASPPENHKACQTEASRRRAFPVAGVPDGRAPGRLLRGPERGGGALHGACARGALPGGPRAPPAARHAAAGRRHRHVGARRGRSVDGPPEQGSRNVGLTKPLTPRRRPTASAGASTARR